MTAREALSEEGSKMKRMICAFFAVLLAAPAALLAEGGGETMTVTGEVVALSCYMSGSTGTSCSQNALSAGEPAALLDATTGVLYILVSPGSASNIARQLASNAGKTLAITGDVQERQGIRTLAVREVREGKGGEEPAGNQASGQAGNVSGE